MPKIFAAGWVALLLLCGAGPVPAEEPEATEATEVEEPATLEAASKFQEGVDLWLAGNREAAIAAWQDAVRLDPDLAEARHNLNLARRDQALLEQRRNCLTQEDPLPCLGAVNHLSKDPPQTLGQSLRALDEAVRFNPKQPESERMRGRIEGRQQDYEQAEQSLTQKLKDHPEDAESHYLLCAALRAQGRYESAAPACEQAIRQRPDYLEAQHLLGSVYLQMGQSEKAVAAFSEVARLAPKSPAAWFNLGLAQGQAGRTQMEIDAYLRALDLGAAPGPVHLNLGAAYDRMKQGSQAIDHTRQAKEGFAQTQQWRKMKQAQRNLDRFMKKYWGLPERPPLF